MHTFCNVQTSINSALKNDILLFIFAASSVYTTLNVNNYLTLFLGKKFYFLKYVYYFHCLRMSFTRNVIFIHLNTLFITKRYRSL